MGKPRYKLIDIIKIMGQYISGGCLC